ncbi:hypothetical protein C1646_754251 [Rhizophagus diaphanus]|nr:hypothetical protein C1646_754251 [Rhizophagus diaphanus] [Rhizophagus sp. MUCL 43196]
MGLHMYEEMNTITLNGIVKDLGIGSLFKTVINKNESIYNLKKAILIKRLKNDDETVESLLGREKIQYAISRIKEHFSNLNEHDIHIVVLGKADWYTVCNKEFRNKEELYEYEASVLHKIVDGYTIKLVKYDKNEPTEIVDNYLIYSSSDKDGSDQEKYDIKEL